MTGKWLKGFTRPLLSWCSIQTLKSFRGGIYKEVYRTLLSRTFYSIKLLRLVVVRCSMRRALTFIPYMLYSFLKDLSPTIYFISCSDFCSSVSSTCYSSSATTSESLRSLRGSFVSN